MLRTSSLVMCAALCTQLRASAAFAALIPFGAGGGAGGGGFGGGIAPFYGGQGGFVGGGGAAPFYGGGIEKFGGAGIAIAEGAGGGFGGGGFGGLEGAGLKYGGGVGGIGLGSGAGFGYAGPKYGGAGFAGPKFGGAGFAGPIGYAGVPIAAGIGIGGGGGGGAGGIGGGEYINKNVYGGAKKDLKDARFETTNGKKGEEFEEGYEGFKKGNAAAKNVKADSGFYADEGSGKKLAEEGKAYSGGQHFNKEGKNGEEKKLKQGHKKGHVIKGFKSSHHKDENGRTEEYYDEENDEGEQIGVDGRSGSFGQKEESSFKGAHEDGEFKANQGKKHGKYDVEHFEDKNNGEGGQYGSKKFGGGGSSYGYDSGIGEESLRGEKEDSKFIKHKPFF